MSRDNNATPQKKACKKDKQRLFLDAYAQQANVLVAARAAGVARQTIYQWLEHDEDFSFAYHQAKEDAKDTLRAEIYRRAVDGWDEDVYQLAKYAGTVRKYDTTLLIFHAKMLMPEYRDKTQVEMSGNVGIHGEVGFYPVQLPQKEERSDTIVDLPGKDAESKEASTTY